MNGLALAMIVVALLMSATAAFTVLVVAVTRD